VAEMSAADAKLGWKPRTPLRTGLAHTIDWYRERGYKARPIK
jgi:nucleoside-diphosphate-sugar epimerase